RPAKEPRLTGTLNDVIGSGKKRTAAKGKNDRIGMQWPQATVTEPVDKVKFRPNQLCSNIDTNKHADNPPHNRHDGKLPHNFIIEDLRICGARILDTHNISPKMNLLFNLKLIPTQ